MSLLRHLALAGSAALLLALAACSKPIPPERSAYVGDWRAPQMRLLITQGGRVEYERHEGSTSTKVSAPLQEFEGDNFTAGVGPMSTTFVVTAPPHRDGDKTVMTVDGVQLEKQP
jgi:hypothetical protein